MNTKLIAASIAFAAIVSVGLGTGRAGQGGRAHRGPGGPFGGPPSPEQMLSRLTEDLDLTSDQAAQIKKIMTDEASEMAELRSNMHDLEAQLHDATANGQFDETTVRGIASQQAAVMTDLIVEHERGKSRTYAVLTPEQRTKFESLRPHGPPPGAGAFVAPPQ